MIVVMAGGLLGLGAAVAGYLAFDLSLLAALAVWMGSGPVTGAVAVALALRRPARPATAPLPRAA